MATTDEIKQLEKLKKYMKENFGVTPENIDKKLNEMRKEFLKMKHRTETKF